jgi:hypothetical protein
MGKNRDVNGFAAGGHKKPNLFSKPESKSQFLPEAKPCTSRFMTIAVFTSFWNSKNSRRKDEFCAKYLSSRRFWQAKNE